jgi:hypothetical protein
VAVALAGQAVDDFVQRAIATAGNHELAAFGAGLLGDFDGVTRRGGLGKLGFDSGTRKNPASFFEQATAATPVVAGVGIVNEQRVSQISGHQVSCVLFMPAAKIPFYII